VRVKLWLERTSAGGGAAAAAELRRRSASRRLLDAEKVMFATDGGGQVWLAEQHLAVGMYTTVHVLRAWHMLGFCILLFMGQAVDASSMHAVIMSSLLQVPEADVLIQAEPWGRWRYPQHAPQVLYYDIGAQASRASGSAWLVMLPAAMLWVPCSRYYVH
jgi:hypothetical protein